MRKAIVPIVFTMRLNVGSTVLYLLELIMARENERTGVRSAPQLKAGTTNKRDKSVTALIYISYNPLIEGMAIWPSGLRRWNQAESCSCLSSPKGRGFESHCCQIFNSLLLLAPLTLILRCSMPVPFSTKPSKSSTAIIRG